VGREGFNNLGRSLTYLTRCRRVAVISYAVLFISSSAQLMVPWLVRKIIDDVTSGVLAHTILVLPGTVQD